MRVVRCYRSKGFTLIELLIVIAIIAILGGILLAAVPQVLTKAKITAMLTTFRSVDQALSEYFVDHQSYPPAYGYKRRTDAQFRDSDPDYLNYYLNPYYQTMKIYNNDIFIDKFSSGYETTLDRDGVLSLFEFSPIGAESLAGDLDMPDSRYIPGGPNAPDVVGDIAQQLGKPERPLVYVPVNSEQADKVLKFYANSGVPIQQWAYARIPFWSDPTTRAGSMRYPPPRYDTYVLVSVGPAGSTNGVVADPIGGENLRDLYHVTGLRAYFLAARDLNKDGNLDFDYTQRVGGRVGVNSYENIDPGNANSLMSLPDGTRGSGPMIYKGGGR